MEPDPPDYDNELERRAAQLFKREHPNALASDLSEEQKQSYRRRVAKTVKRSLERPGIVRLRDWFKRMRHRNEP
jgi:aminoglycoside/choline kinase family phosphotransferase